MKNVSVMKIGFALLLVLLLFPPIRSVSQRGETTRVRSSGHAFVLSMPASSIYLDYQIDYPRLATLAAVLLLATGIGAAAFRKST